MIGIMGLGLMEYWLMKVMEEITFLINLRIFNPDVVDEAKVEKEPKELIFDEVEIIYHGVNA